MNFTTLIVLSCLCISAIYAHKLGNTHESSEQDVNSSRQKRQVCNDCIVGPPSGYNPGRPNYNRPNYNRPTQRSSYNRRYTTTQRRYNSNNNRNTNPYGGGNFGNGCRCIGDTCYNCSFGK